MHLCIILHEFEGYIGPTLAWSEQGLQSSLLNEFGIQGCYVGVKAVGGARLWSSL